MKGKIRGQEERERKWNEWRNEHIDKMNEMKDVIRDHCGTLQRMTYAGAVASKPKVASRETTLGGSDREGQVRNVGAGA
jgi:hypothetical protein